jgi:hypothetical protein
MMSRYEQFELHRCGLQIEIGPPLSENFHSNFLFATPSFAEGAGRLVDFGNFLTEYNTTRTSEEADKRATTQDWLAVGDDMRQAISAFPDHVNA